MGEAVKELGPVVKEEKSSSKLQKILVVDDSALVRSEVKEMLDQGKYQILEAEDGEVGLAQLKEHPDVAMIFLDINMPVMDGITMAHKVAEQHESGVMKEKMPIVMLTTENSKEMVIKGKAAGVMGWIIKPPQRGHVIKIVEKLARK